MSESDFWHGHCGYCGFEFTARAQNEADEILVKHLKDIHGEKIVRVEHQYIQASESWAAKLRRFFQRFFECVRSTQRRRKKCSSEAHVNALQEGWLRLPYWDVEHFMRGARSICGQRFYAFARGQLASRPSTSEICETCWRLWNKNAKLDDDSDE
jgi:hypothetical protein